MKTIIVQRFAVTVIIATAHFVTALAASLTGPDPALI